MLNAPAFSFHLTSNRRDGNDRLMGKLYVYVCMTLAAIGQDVKVSHAFVFMPGRGSSIIRLAQKARPVILSAATAETIQYHTKLHELNEST